MPTATLDRPLAKVYPMRTPQEKRDGYLARLSRLQSDRSGWDSHWYECGRLTQPRSARFTTSERNRAGRSKYDAIINNTATRAIDVLNAGLSNGLTNSASPWFEITTKDPDLREIHEVRLWLDEVTRRMRVVFNGRSNVYGGLRHVYDDLAVFGTSAMLVLPDFESLIRCYPLPVGQFYLQQDYQGRVVTMYRVFSKTVGETVREFGHDNVSTHVLHAWNARQHELPVDILHVIEPRDDQERVPNSPMAIHMPWRSVYLEIGGQSDRMLREGGFRRFPVLAPRWQVNGEDVYGISPTMKALGDIKQLQQMEFRTSQAIDYMVRPPLQVPISVKEREREFLPGGVTYYEPGTTVPHDQAVPQGGVRPLYQPNLDLSHMERKQSQVELRISQAFHEDAFLMFQAIDSGRMTAEEARYRQGEKLQMLGPVVDRVTNEVAEPLIDLTFAEMMAVGALPPIPDVLAGHELSVEFVGVLAQAQRAVGVSGVQQWVSETLVVAQARPDVLDNIDFDQWARHTADMRGVDTKLLVDPDSVDQLRAARAQAQAAQEQVAMAGEQAKTINQLANAPVAESNALSELVRRAQVAGAA